MQTFTKQPQETLDYVIDLSSWLDPTDSIVSATVTADTGLTVVETDINSPKVSVWLSGGTDGVTYHVQALITTRSSPARVKDVDFKVKVKEQ